VEHGRKWKIYNFNFDNIFNAFMTLYVTTTYDHLSFIINVASNSNIESIGPQRNKNQIITYAYIGIFMIIGNYFFLNLILGMMFNEFEKINR
jgi:hypothetical protein